jgi:hypothetical protein
MNSLGLPRVTFYVIRHKASGEVMPLIRRGRGYSWWNPAVKQESHPPFMIGIPRLFANQRNATKAIEQWLVFPNGRRKGYQDSTGDWDEIVVSKDDGRKKSDLDIIKVRLLKVEK